MINDEAMAKIVGTAWLWLPLMLYIMFDVNYFLRTGLTVGLGWIMQKKHKVTDMTTIYGVCTTQDVDIFMRHMNNARYLRELDFACYDFYTLTRLYRRVRQRGGSIMRCTTSIRYRRSIYLFQPYKICTRLVWWDDKAVYLEQQFITLSDGFVRAVVFTKQCITDCSVLEVLSTYPEVAGALPELPAELKLFLDAIEVSSQKLRKHD
ncbi:protein THEM6-like [Drosophila busckii]|uniref:protein THEM6-like n=1 Tax=Drosophila busckii TaxID=30019 RepID=UPI00083ECB88|nr:protein THEM6-like [Drosophila busckii]